MEQQEAALMVCAFVSGWWLRGRLAALALRLGLQLLTSGIGKREVLKALARGIERIEKAS